MSQAKGEHGTTETVRVKADNEQGYTVINKSDFKDEEHTLVEPKKGKAGGKRSKYEDMTKEELMDELDKKNVQYTQHETKEELLKKLSK